MERRGGALRPGPGGERVVDEKNPEAAHVLRHRIGIVRGLVMVRLTRPRREQPSVLVAEEREHADGVLQGMYSFATLARRDDGDGVPVPAGGAYAIAMLPEETGEQCAHLQTET